MNRGAIIFDLDDTLVDTSDMFWRVRSQFLGLVARLGFDRKEVEELFERIDAAKMAELGFSPARYASSMAATLRLLNRKRAISNFAEVLRAVEDCGAGITRMTPSVISGARELLRWCMPRFTLALVTRGEIETQMEKVRRTRLERYFQEIAVVPAKTPMLFADVFARCRAANRWVIGDSVQTDVNVGIQAAAQCILFEYKHPVYEWRYELSQPAIGSFFRVKMLKDAIPILDGREKAEAIAGYQTTTRLRRYSLP